VELLASLAIVAAVVAVLTVSVRGSVIAAEWHRAIGDVRHLDSMARIRSRTDGPVLIACGDDGRRLLATRQSDSAALMTIELPFGITASILTGDQAGFLLVDGSGRSVDATYLLIDRARTIRLPVSGLSGQHAAKVEGTP
jgi:hypothetical protein